MINLIKKDLALNVNKRTLWVFIVYFFIIVITSESYLPSNNKYIIIVSTMAYFIAAASFSFDDRLKGDYIINSLPIKRKDIVLAKYVSIILYTIVALVFTGVLGGLISYIGIFENLDYINLNVISKSMIAVFLMCSLNFPLYFTKGYRVGKIISFAIYFGFFAIANSLYGEVSTGLILKIKSIFNSSSTFLNGIVLVIMVCVFILSIFISIGIYEKKEL
ncbi:ABC-2 transporter permease [Clostridium brassicae]|uniref:ABC-2 transporter permease n=1 Tax=Clostridium brassicae TaxID=2999072 RepID=A0ABT4DDG0_9CLOT|nr:ABC-2 transporter permease [Clostridium brassicae]MCY6960358.1 ABC-2 transporter permease [Clostridium brassicae]